MLVKIFITLLNIINFSEVLVNHGKI